jgi:tetratricopeptide (TPR) repeat protein
VSVVWLLIASRGLAQSPLSPAEQKIAWARQAIAAQPQRYEAYNDLALALVRRARETADPAYYAQAEEALTHSFRLAPENLAGQRIRVQILLGQRDLAPALELATALNKRIPDDVLVYGLLADAHMALGNYDEAEHAAQWMLDLRPHNVPGLLRAAALRELFGDVEGALDMLAAAYQRIPVHEVEERAWILTQMAHLQLLASKLDTAHTLLQQALSLFPTYPYTLATLAEVRTAQKKYAEAIDLWRQCYEAAPHPKYLYGRATVLEHTGRRQEAQRAYAAFEQQARRVIQRSDNANRELVWYYADRARKPLEALRIARLEVARRRDVHTLDAYAWALHVTGSHAEARQHIEQALAVGIREARLFYHAGAIAAKLNDRTAAARYLQQSLALAASPEVSAAARQALARLQSASTRTTPRR